MPKAFRLCLTLLVAAAWVGRLPAREYVWIEGEEPAAINVKPNIAGWGNKQFLSGEKWLHVSIDADKVGKEVPAEGVLIKYAFKAPKDGKYEVWDRIGFEFVRSPFAWRIDDGAWKSVSPEELTTDLMEVSFFCEVAWLQLGAQALTAGDHTLEIKLPRTKDAQGKTARILYASDALCLIAGHFHPNSHYKPDEDGRDAADRTAAAKVFDMPAPPGDGARAGVKLEGSWEVCRNDEQMPGEVAEPMKDFPERPHWKAIAVPGDKNTLRPDLVFAHRLWYRTHVRVPEGCAGRSFYLVFPENNLNTTVFVNGTYCGFNKNPFARFAIDVTDAVKPGVNEVRVGIRDAWYGYSANSKDPLKLRKRFNLPIKFSQDGFQDLAYPIWSHFESGILVTPEFVAAGGSAYAADVFCMPSVADKRLTVQLTLRNTSANEVRGDVVLEAVNDATGKLEKAFQPVQFSAPAHTPVTFRVREGWDNPKLWWPDDPNLYRLRATLRVGGKTADVSETTFGFREWTTEGKDFKLNGVPWHGWADTHSEATKEEWVKFHRATNQRFMRFWGTRWQGMPPDQALDFLDKSGIVVRRSGMLDGEAIGYMAIETDPALQKKYNSPIKMDLMNNWRDQVVAQVEGERNHPSVMIWSIENEYLYINCINLYGGLMDQFEAETVKTSDAVRAADPTRPTMTDGGGATKSNRMPVHGDHYTTGEFSEYPDLAYTPNTKGGGRGRWEWDQERPRFIGEELFAQGHNPKYAYFGGEEVFVGQQKARRAVGIFTRMLTEGYRWEHIGAVHFWQMPDAAEGQYAANAPRAVFCRQWDWTFGPGRKVKRTFGLFNDTHSDEPITFIWSLSFGGKRVAGETKEYQVAPGADVKFDVDLPMPEVDARREGELALVLTAGGKEVFRDTKAVSVLATGPKQAKPPGVRALTAKDLLVYDPQGAVVTYLKERDVPFTELHGLKDLPETAKLLVVGKDALSPAEATSSALAAWAAGGRRVIVLEQKNPLKYQGLPAAMAAATNEGRTAFAEDLGHPALQRLQRKDFFTWGPGEVVYRNAYLKPTRGGRSLVQCHDELRYTALAEVPVGPGLLLLSQLAVGEKLADNAVAQQLLMNLLDYAADYRLEYREVAAALDGAPQLARALDAVGLRYSRAKDAVAALETRGARIAVIAATPANLKALVDHPDRVQRFLEDGGWVVFNGLTPEGLADYNKLVGFDHMIRPFRRERVTFPPVKHPLTSGLTTGDVVMYTSEQIFPWQPGNYVVSDEFSYVVDYEDVAPFAQFPNPFLENMVNGFVSADAWKYIVNVPAPDKPPLDWVLKLPKEQEIREVEWIGNTFYYPVTKFALLFDGKDPVAFDVKPTNDPQALTVDPPRRGKDITLRLAEWEKLPGKAQVTGLDNIRLFARRPPDFYEKVRPLLNVGGLMAYPRGPGGILLCNLLFKDREEVPENAVKKQTILATLLRNLKAPFAGKTIVAGADLKYELIDLSKQANQYRDEKGWFGDKNFTFKDLPTGRHTFAGVPFQVYDFPTSPVPTVVMLGGPGVPNNLPSEVRGIPVDRKADALFFLQAARIDSRRNAEEVKQGKKYELCRYVVTYADGQKAEVPVYAEIDVDDYRQQTPVALPGAQVGWTKPYGQTGTSAVAYVQQWNNPRPDVAIRSIDLAYGKERRGVPALLAVIAATAAQATAAK
jgi:beta-galactosidase